MTMETPHRAAWHMAPQEYQLAPRSPGLPPKDQVGGRAQPAAPCNWDRGVQCPSFFPGAPGLHCRNGQPKNAQPSIDRPAHLITHLVYQPDCSHLLLHTHMMSFISLHWNMCKKLSNIISSCWNTFLFSGVSPKTTK